jgi:hypothetical protein
MKQNNNILNRFNIDFFEFSFLVEACIPPRPIARMTFWFDVCDKYYHVLTQEERSKLFEWIQRNPSFDLKNEDCKLFYDRYNPDNQYSVTTNYKNEIKDVKCFLHNNKYHTKSNTSINEEYIKEIKNYYEN